jgi:PelA/Pel-15E family pectate lyase
LERDSGQAEGGTPAGGAQISCKVALHVACGFASTGQLEGMNRSPRPCVRLIAGLRPKLGLVLCLLATLTLGGCRSAAVGETNTGEPATPAIAPKPAARVRWGEAVVNQKPDWYTSPAARVMADSVLQYQSPEGAWAKNTDLSVAPTPALLADIAKGGKANTIDNNGTVLPLRFMALMAQATGRSNYQASFQRGLDYLLAAQYPNGGWPQFYPLRPGYYSHITYNDNAMVNVLNLLRDIAAGRAPYGFVKSGQRERSAAAVQRGLDCILRTQVRQNGKLTVWCAQHDVETFKPAWARNFEPPSLSGAESAGIVQFLMSVEHPTPEIIVAVEGAVAWFESAKISGLRYRRGTNADGRRDGWVVKDETASPLWARFYELETDRPIFLGRDKAVHYALHEIEQERRAGYVYYGDWAAELIARDYPRWRARHGLP